MRVSLFNQRTCTILRLSLYGMKNAFICRFFAPDSEDVVSQNLFPLREDQFISFPNETAQLSPTPSCYARRVWEELVDIQEALRKALSTTSSKQKDHWFRKEKVRVSNEAWSYIENRLQAEIPDLELKRGHAKSSKNSIGLGMQ